MKAVGCIATVCLLVTYLGTCQGASTTADSAVTTAAAGAVTTAAGGVTTAAPAGGVTTAAPGTTAAPVAVGGACSGGKTCVAGLVCDTTCKLGPGGSCASPNAANCQTGTTCTANSCTLNAGVVGFACTDNSNCTAANSECDTTTTHTCKCKSGITPNTINLTCPSGSATVMASVLVLAVAFVKTQLF